MGFKNCFLDFFLYCYINQLFSCNRSISLFTYNIISIRFVTLFKTKWHKTRLQCKQEAHGPWVAYLSSIANADMQMLCNIFPILSSQLMKRSSFKQLLILKKNIIYGMTVNGA